MPLKKKNRGIVPWDYQIGDENYQIEAAILKKVKGYITIKKDNNNSVFFLKKYEEKRLSINASQAKLTHDQLIEFGYKLRKPNVEFED